jgi:hypothetical protein
MTYRLYTQAGGITPFESIPRLLESLQILALVWPTGIPNGKVQYFFKIYSKTTCSVSLHVWLNPAWPKGIPLRNAIKLTRTVIVNYFQNEPWEFFKHFLTVKNVEHFLHNYFVSHRC